MNRKHTAWHSKRGEHGQVLILAVVAIILVILAVLLLFDVQTVIRGKVKAQNGVDAAALTAAEWQKHSLNLIGELNLVRATGTLISEPFFADGILKDPNINFDFPDVINPNFPPVEQEEFLLFPEKSEFINEDGELDKAKLHNELARVELEKRFLEILDRLVSQLQTRIAFTGPLIAFGAAQQAAKNNGITYDPDAGQFFAFYLEIVEHNMLYSTIDPLFFGYDWRNSYVSMLNSAFDISYGKDEQNFDPFAGDGTALYGIAVGTKFKFTGMPELKGDPPTDLSYYFAQKETYEMIHARNWCWLDQLLQLDFYGNWWTSFLCEPNNDNFPRQSEILPLGITFSSNDNSSDIYNEAESSGALARYANNGSKLISETFNQEIPYAYTEEGNQTESERQEGNKTIYETFSEISIARSSWDIEREVFEQTYNDKDADRRYDILPHLSWALFDYTWTPYGETKTEWEEYLRGDFKPGLDYQSGARAFFETKQNTVTISGTMGRPGRTNGTNFGQVFSNTAAGADARAASGTIYRLNNIGKIEANAIAKPIGRINTENGKKHLRPFEAGRMILPVFTKTALIPISLEPVEGFSMLDIAWLYYLTEFVPLLADSLTLEDAWARAMERYPNHLRYFLYYYQALCMINDQDFRQSGLDWLDATAIWGKDDEDNPFPLYTNREHHCYGLGVETNPPGGGGGSGGGGNNGSGGSGSGGGGARPPQTPTIIPGDKKGPSSLH